MTFKSIADYKHIWNSDLTMYLTSYLRTALFCLLVLNVPKSLAQDPTGNSPTSTNKSRLVLNFPKDVSCGRLYICPADYDPLVFPGTSLTPRPHMFTVVGAAKGTIVLPSTTRLKLSPSPALLRDPGLLDNIPTANFDMLSMDGADVDATTMAKLISRFPRIRRLDLTRAEVDDQCLSKLNPPKDLETLSLNGTQISGTALKNLAYLKKLRMLVLANTPLKREGYQHLADLRSIITLDMSHTRTTDTDMHDIAKLANLKSIELVGCGKLTNACIESINSLKQLNQLDIKATGVTGKGLLKLKSSLPVHQIYVYTDQISTAEVSALRAKFPKASIDVVPHDKAMSLTEAERYFHPLK